MFYTVRKTVVALCAVAAITVLSTTQARALSQLDFGIVSPTGGAISYAGGAAPLVGTDIEVDNVVGLNTPLHNFVLVDLVDALLNFETGNLISHTANSWTFAGGGFIEIRGGVDFLDAPDIPAGSLLLSGTFNEATVVMTNTSFKVAIVDFNDEKHPGLLEYFGLPGNMPYSGSMNLSFNTFATPPDGFVSDGVLSGDLVNHVLVPSPVAASMGLATLVSMGAVGFVRRRRQA